MRIRLGLGEKETWEGMREKEGEKRQKIKMNKNRRSEEKRDEGEAEGGRVIITGGEGGQSFGSLPVFIKQSLFLTEEEGPIYIIYARLHLKKKNLPFLSIPSAFAHLDLLPFPPHFLSSLIHTHIYYTYI